MLRSPFKEEGLNLYGLFGKISKGEYPPISEVYSRELRELVDQMLIIDPAKRVDVDVRSPVLIVLPMGMLMNAVGGCGCAFCDAGCVFGRVEDARALYQAP
jgi:hypothetical protein